MDIYNNIRACIEQAETRTELENILYELSELNIEVSKDKTRMSERMFIKTLYSSAESRKNFLTQLENSEYLKGLKEFRKAAKAILPLETYKEIKKVANSNL